MEVFMKVDMKEAYLLRGGKQLQVVFVVSAAILAACLFLVFASPLVLLDVFDVCAIVGIFAALATPFVFVWNRWRKTKAAARQKEDLRSFNKIFKRMAIDIFRKENHRLVQMHIDVMFAILAVKREEAAQKLFEATVDARTHILPGMRVHAIAEQTKSSKIAIGKYRRAVEWARRCGYEVKANHKDYIDRFED